jgi:hypothetical protein
MRTYVLALLLLSCYSYALTARNFISYASSYSNSNNVDDESQSTGAPDGSGATFTESNSRLTWNMGAGLPSSINNGVVVLKSSSGGFFDFDVFPGSHGTGYTFSKDLYNNHDHLQRGMDSFFLKKPLVSKAFPLLLFSQI